MSVLRRLGVAGAVVVAVLVGAVPAASAHAVLLRTDPSPQTTVKKAPTAVKLDFSEPVEVSFGAVRVFDVDATRVDTGTISRASGNREVSVAVRPLNEGTYTVTWRVVSADGHPVHGGFSFYVGAPSAISPVAVSGNQGAGRVIGWGYGVVRFVWFGAFLALVGMVALRAWVWTPAVRATGLGDSEAAVQFRRRFARALPLVWVALVVAGGLELVFQTASVSGLSLVSSAHPHVLSQLLGTTYGRY